MGNKGTIIKSISFPVELWNEIQEHMKENDMSFSRFLQSSSKLKLKASKLQNARELLDLMNPEEIAAFKKEIKKRGL